MVTPNQFPASNIAGDILNTQLEVSSTSAQCVQLTLTEPMTLSFGTFSDRPSGWLALTGQANGHAVVGYGEGATLPQPVFTDDYGGNIAQNMSELARAATPNSEIAVGAALQIVQDYRFADSGHYPTARLATEMALLDAATKVHGTSVREFIGIPPKITDVPYGKSIGGATTETILRQAEDAIGQNAKKIKVKIAPHIFTEVIAAIDTLQQDHPGVELMVDANGGFDPHDQEHVAMLGQLDERQMLMIEEPVSRLGSTRGLDAVRALRRVMPSLSTSVCLDDCLRTFEDCQTVLNEGLADIINIKPGRVGSFLRSLKLVDFAARQGAEVMVGGMLEGTPGRCMTTLLGAYCLSQGFTVPGDLSLAQERLTSDLVPLANQLTMSQDGNIVLPRGNGWGF
jgi:o-succinylbenzoate synthase